MDEARLRDKLAKLERLASDRNPNEHEREVARRKAMELRARLPTRKENFEPLVERLRNVARAQERYRDEARKEADAFRRARERIEERVNWLNRNLHRLKPSGQVFAADLCAQWYSRGWLSEKQLNSVEQLINEAKGN